MIITEDNWGDVFTKASLALLDALSYVDEFDKETFMSSAPADSQRAGKQAIEFINQASPLIKLLMRYRPKVSGATVSAVFWKTDEAFNKAKNILEFLRKTVVVLSELDKKIKSIRGVSFFTARKGLMSFKKLCLKSLNGLNSCIAWYNNRYVEEEYQLEPIKLVK